MFLKNAWYVAAWDHELAAQLLPVRVLGEAIVLYRQTNGTVVALEDACPHRKLPLSMGRIKGDHVECGYHGLTFDGKGICTRVPGVEKIPHVARVQAYPIVERYGLLWVWMGPADQADATKIFDVDHWGDPAWGLNRGDAMTLECNYLYMTDNLLDPSHVAWVHPSSFGNAAAEEAPLQTTIGEHGVTVWRWMLDVEPAPFYAPYLKFNGPCDRKQHYEVHYPCHAIIKAVFTPPARGARTAPCIRMCS
jgi:phenylpropionate dioxygenase-like ring-hydroxylating dioxygenase large terminal subunit